jgi:hypothetical protein
VAPGIAEVSQLMAERFKTQAEAAESELQRSRASANGAGAKGPGAGWEDRPTAFRSAHTNAERDDIAIAASGATSSARSQCATRR